MRTRRLFTIVSLLAVVAAFAAAWPARADHMSEYASLRWRSIGPAVSGGRATAVAGTDDDASLYYVGTAGGGVFKTADGGAHWTSVWATQKVGPIGAVAIAPHHPDIVWVGTGEANLRNDVSYGDGVYVSTDAGKTWRHRGLDATSQISRILIDPKSPNTVLVAALGDPFADDPERGVFKTTDGGKTWTKTLYDGPASGASDLAWNASAPNVVFAGLWQYRRNGWSGTSGGAHDALYRSNDEGSTWTKLSGHGLPVGQLGRVGVAVAPNDARRVYAMIESRQGLLWRSDDGGSAWRLVSSDTLMDQRPFYYTHAYVDPTDKDHLLAVSVDLAESRDGGRSWTKVDSAVHGDHHDIWWAAGGQRIADANDGGTALSGDGGQSWEWRNNYAAGQIYRVGLDDEEPYEVCVGLQDNDGWCGPSNTGIGGIPGRDWIDVGGGDSTWVVPDPVDPTFVWVASGGGYNAGALSLYDRRTGFSTDISPFEGDIDAIGVAGLRYRFNWESPLAFLPQDPHVAYFGGNVLFETRDRGRHWTSISPDLTLNDEAHQQISGGITHDGTGAEAFDTILAVAPSPLRRGVIWVGTDDGVIQLTKDAGRRWSNVSVRGIGPYGRIANIDASAHDPAGALVIVDRHYSGDRRPYIFETADYGASWRPLAANLPRDQFVRTVVADPRNPRVLYAGLEQSAWISFDGGASWDSLQLGMPAASVRDLRIQPRDNDLVAGTHGRSAWILDDLTPLQMLDAARTHAQFLFPIRTAYALQNEPVSTANGGPSAFEGDTSTGALISYYLAAKTKNVWIEILDASGRHVRSLKPGNGDAVSGHAGINRVGWDLTFDKPTPWESAPKWNRDAVAPVSVGPGDYFAVLQAGGKVALSRRFAVKEDPRADWSEADEAQWRSFALDVANRTSTIDAMLNRLDAIDGKLASVARGAAAKPSVQQAVAAAKASVTRVRALLTSSPRNDQDDDFLPDMVREKLQALSFTEGSAPRTPPTQAQQSQLDEIAKQQNAARLAYEALVRDQLPALNALLKAAGLAMV